MVRQTPPFHVCVHVLLALPSVLGAWSMTLVIWLPFNYKKLFLPGIDRPNLLSLYQLGDIRIIEETATQYFKIGVHLLNDQYGNRVEAINVDKRTAAEKITEVYRTWLREESYASWATLCGCFRKCGFKSLAQRIEEHFRISSSQPTPLPGIYVAIITTNIFGEVLQRKYLRIISTKFLPYCR